jgi:hypothetical protein
MILDPKSFRNDPLEVPSKRLLSPLTPTDRIVNGMVRDNEPSNDDNMSASDSDEEEDLEALYESYSRRD